jgi:ABC-type polysaccharide/polyol phosphate export permease
VPRGFASLNSFTYKTSNTHHENYCQLIWMLAKMDFKLRYQNSILGYIWAILKPLLMFFVLNFVFSSIFNQRNIVGEHYTLGLLVALVLFYFFSEATNAGMQSLKSKSMLVEKIYLPRWTIIVASTIHTALIFLSNISVIIVFFIWYRFLPSPTSILLFVIFSLFMYLFILSFSLMSAPLFIRFRDLGMIWEVAIGILFYASPIFYPLQMLPEWIQRILLINPVAFMIHFTKESMFNHHYAEMWQFGVFLGSNCLLFISSIWAYKKLIQKIAERL